jgi:hypothetical protein
MPQVKLPDGRIANFPDDMPREQIKAFIAQKFPDQVQAAPQQPQSAPATAADTSGIIPQGLSGLNEGAANLLSLPNTVEMGLRSIGPAIGNAMGGEFAMPTESWLPDAGASFRNLGENVGAIKPETDNPAGRFSRRVGQEVGAALIPALGTPAKAAALLSATGSGVGAATMQQAMPGNPAAEIAGQLIGGLAPLGVANRMERSAMAKAATPTVEGLKDEAGALYDAARASGVVAPQQATQALNQSMQSIAKAEGLISPTGRVNSSYPRINGVLNTFEDYSAGTMDIAQAQATRKVLTDAAKSVEPGEKRIAAIMLEEFDKFLDPLAPQIAQANQIYSRAKKGELIEQAIELAGSRAGQFSGSGFENALRTEFRSLERQIIKGQLRGLSEAEVDAITKVAQGGPIENALRFVGKFAPTGNVSTVLGGSAGFAAGGPLGAAAVLGLGAAGRGAATRMTTGNAHQAVVQALMGGKSIPIPNVAPNTATAASALAVGQAANQNKPVSDEIARLLVRANALN